MIQAFPRKAPAGKPSIIFSIFELDFYFRIRQGPVQRGMQKANPAIVTENIKESILPENIFSN